MYHNRLILSFVMIIMSLPALFAEKATNITYNEIPNQVHRTSTHFEVTANGIELPVVNGLYRQNGSASYQFLNYDYTTFSASEGVVTIRLKYHTVINSIKISPLKLNIEVTKIDDRTYEFDVPEPKGKEQYYLIANVNGERLVIARDPEETDVPVVGADGVFNVVDELNGLDATLQENTVAVAEAFQQAVDKANVYGTENNTQGVVYVPSGLYYMGNLMLKSNVALYMAPGSVIKFSDYKEHYTEDYYKQSLARWGTWWIYTDENSENIKVYGRGTFDGNGHYHQKDRPSGVQAFANHMFVIMGTKDFLFDGPIIKESAFWGTIVVRSQGVTFRNVKLLNSMDANENDGIDVCESQDVLVEKAIGIALDDPFSTKTWQQDTDICPKWYGEPQPLDNVTFRNCISLTYCGAFKCGHGAMQTQSNILVENAVVVGSGRAIGIEPKYSSAGRDKGYRNIIFQNIDIEGSGGEGWLKILADNPEVGNPPLKGVLIKDVHIRHAGSTSTLRGYDENSMVEDVVFENITMYGNSKPVTSLSELNILNAGFYKNVEFKEGREEHEPVYRIEAEYANVFKDISIEATTDGEGSHLTSLNNSDYVVYRNVDFGSNTSNIKFRMKVNKTFTMELYLNCIIGNDRSLIGGELVKSIELPASSEWADMDVAFEGLEGTQDLFILFTDNSYDALGYFNWFELTREFYDIEGIVLEYESLELNVGQSQALTPVFTPANAYIKEVVWSIENESEEGVVTIGEDGILRASKEGTATVRVTSVANTDYTATLEVRVEEKGVSDTKRIMPEEVDMLFGKDWQGNTGIRVSNGRFESIWHNNYAVFKDVNFGEYTSSIRVEYCVPRESKVELWIDRKVTSDGTLYDGVHIGTGIIKTDNMSWDTWTEFDIPVSLASGIHDLYLEFSASGATATNQQFGTISWLELTRYFLAEMESIVVEPESVTLYPGGRQKLNLTILPEEAASQELVWTIEEQSLPGVIEIIGDEIKAVRAGTAKVRIECFYNPSVYAIVEVTVQNYENTDIIRVWAKDAVAVYDTYHFGDQSAISIGAINDPEEENGTGINSCWNGNFAIFKDVDFGIQTVGATIRKGYPRGSKMELWIDREVNESSKTAIGGSMIGSIEFPEAATNWDRWQTFETEIEGASGIHDLCLMFLAGGGSADNQNYGSLNWIDFTRVVEIEGIGNENPMVGVEIYPNPVSDVLKISSDEEIRGITVFDISGRKIYTQPRLNKQEVSLAVSDWNEGVYIVYLETVKGNSIHKIIKK